MGRQSRRRHVEGISGMKVMVKAVWRTDTQISDGGMVMVVVVMMMRRFRRVMSVPIP